MDGDFPEVVDGVAEVAGGEEGMECGIGLGGRVLEGDTDGGADGEAEFFGQAEAAGGGLVGVVLDAGGGGGDGADAGQGAEVDASVFSGAEGGLDVGAVVVVVDAEGDGAVGQGFAVASAEFETVAIGGGGKVGGADAGGLEGAVDLEGFGGGEFDGIAAGGGFGGGVEGECEGEEVGGDEEGDGEGFGEFEGIGDDAFGGDVAEQGGGEGEGGVFEAVERDGMAVVGEADAEPGVGLLFGEELFAVDEETGFEFEGVGAGEEGEFFREFSGGDGGGGLGLVGGIGDVDAGGGGVGGEGFGAEGEGELGDGAGVFIEEAEGLPGGITRDVVGEAAFADEGAGGGFSRDEFDDPGAGAGELGEFEFVGVEEDGGLAEAEGAGVVGDEAVEVEGGLGCGGGGVDFVDADEEAGGVFEEQGECDVGLGGEMGGGGGCEVDAGFFEEVFVLVRGEFGGPGGGGRAGEEAGAGMERAEFFLKNERDEVAVGGVGLGEEMEEEGFDEGGVVVDGGAVGELGEAFAEANDIGAFFVGPEDGVVVAREGEVAEEVVFGRGAELLLEAEVVEEDVGFEGVLGGWQGEGVIAEGFQVGGVGGAVGGEGV